MSDDRQEILTCGEHQFVIVVWPTKQEMSCRGTPGHRVHGCSMCDAAVEKALELCGV